MNLLYMHSTTLGYGRMGVHIAKALEDLGVKLYDDLEPSGPVPSHADYIRHKTAGLSSGRSKMICWLTVPTHARGWWEGQIPTIFTMWEAMHLPEGFRETLHNFDTVIVPSPQNLELFSEYHPNVKYVPLGVDPTRWHPIEREMPTTEFRFLIGGAGKRKGTDLAVAAFKKLWPRGTNFGDKPIPTLTLKNPRGEPLYGERISMVAGKMSDDEESDLYASAHCYLQPSRGEGFGLQPLQAIAQGCPTILTNAHGHASFAQHGIGITAKPAKADYFIYGDAGEWWEPSFDELCEAMLDVYERYDFHRKMALIAGHEASETFTWRNTALGLIDALGPERMTPYDGAEVWVKSEGMLYEITTRVDWYCEIAGANLFFEKGKTYYEVADIKRILFEAGVLDPVCINAGGLSGEQVARLGKYRAQYENCPTCGNALQHDDDLDARAERSLRSALGPEPEYHFVESP